MSIAAIAESRITRTTPSSVCAVLPSHAYADHANHSTARIARPSTSRDQEGCAATNPVTWVIANTNTRSKNSSSGVTRCSAASGVSSMASGIRVG